MGSPCAEIEPAERTAHYALPRGDPEPHCQHHRNQNPNQGCASIEWGRETYLSRCSLVGAPNCTLAGFLGISTLVFLGVGTGIST